MLRWFVRLNRVCWFSLKHAGQYASQGPGSRNPTLKLSCSGKSTVSVTATKTLGPSLITLSFLSTNKPWEAAGAQKPNLLSSHSLNQYVVIIRHSRSHFWFAHFYKVIIFTFGRCVHQCQFQKSLCPVGGLNLF